jgi:hypothetical protein
MRKKKINLLLPISNCCLKKFYDLDSISKYGSIIVVSIILLSQIYNIIIGFNYRMSFFSIIINIFFLLTILTKLEIIKVTILEEKVNSILKFMIFVFILNFLGYTISDSQIHHYIFAPISFLGVYFTWLLLYK